MPWLFSMIASQPKKKATETEPLSLPVSVAGAGYYINPEPVSYMMKISSKP
jgi:hypothetical protein